MMKVAVLMQATGSYAHICPRAVNSLRRFFLPGNELQILVYSDGQIGEGITPRKLPNVPGGFWTDCCYDRYELFVDASSSVAGLDYLFYVDADMEAVAPITPDLILPRGDEVISASEHLYYLTQSGLALPEHSSMYPRDFLNEGPIWQGCLWGGRTEAVLEMSRTLAEVARREKGTLPKNNADEGLFNSYWIMRKNQVRTLPVAFCAPTMVEPDWPPGPWCDLTPERVFIWHHNATYFGLPE
jgi:hypothetical protein